MVIDAWATSVETHGKAAARRARDILYVLQQTYEAERDGERMPDAHCFVAVLNAISKVDGAAVARDYLVWMEGLYRNGKNENAQPSMGSYVTVLRAFADSGDDDAGVQAESLLRHMTEAGVAPTTLCYNIVINAYVR